VPIFELTLTVSKDSQFGGSGTVRTKPGFASWHGSGETIKNRMTFTCFYCICPPKLGAKCVFLPGVHCSGWLLRELLSLKILLKTTWPEVGEFVLGVAEDALTAL
jgi:hypothetical protein